MQVYPPSLTPWKSLRPFDHGRVALAFIKLEFCDRYFWA